MKHLISSLVNLIKWETLILFIVILLITLISVFFEMDTSMYRFAQGQSEIWITIFQIPFSFGSIFIITILVCVVFGGKESKESRYNFISAIIICLLTNGLMKVLTGRIEPGLFFESSINEIAKSFTFSPLEGKLLGAFPSGHAMISSAIMISIISSSSNKFIIGVILFWGIWANLATVLGNHGDFHWLSDVLIGFILGSYISFTTHQNKEVN